MIISKTPFRISFFGGGTDYPVWFQEHGGAVLGTTIDKYCYIMARYLPPNFKDKYRIVHAAEEFVNTLEEIRHPAIRACINFMEIDRGLEIIHWADMPARKGMGTSSAFVVGLLNALKGGYGSSLELAQNAIEVEQRILKENVGCQDQYLSALGGFSHLVFERNGKIHNIFKGTDDRCLAKYLMLFDTGTYRIASEIAAEQIRVTPWKQDELMTMQKMVYEALEILESGDILDFGLLLGESWKFKRSLTSKISTPRIDSIYKIGCKAGAIGGKLLGAGGGGYMLFFVEPDKQHKVRLALADLLYVPFKFETRGSEIIYGLCDS